jgi:branched-chain amino acid transport system substrate-binding protein
VITIGNISSVTGQNVLPDGSEGANAYFNYLNAHGGINGHKVKFVIADDQGNAQDAAQAASRLVNQDNVVGLVASDSILECSINTSLYSKAKVLDIADQGVDSGCFDSANIGPVNTGPFTALQVNLTYAVKVLHYSKVCVLIPDLPGIQAGDAKAIVAWTKATGKKLALSLQDLSLTGDPTASLLRAKSAGCQAVASNGPAAYLAAFIKAAAAQNLTKSIKFLFPTTAYDPSFLSAAGSAADGAIINSEFLPYTSTSSALTQAEKVFKAEKVPLGSQYLGGYIGAEIFAKVVSGIKGTITRASVTNAFRHMKPYSTPLMGDAYVFGPGKSHNPNRSSKFLTVKNGKFVQLSTSWFHI